MGVNENLLAAAKAGKAAEVRKLLATSGVNVTVRDGDGRTPLSLAAASGHADVVRVMLDSPGGAGFNIPDLRGCSPLFLASENGRMKVVKLLLSVGADRTIRDVEGRTALEIAKLRGHTSVAKVLDSKDRDERNQRDAVKKELARNQKLLEGKDDPQSTHSKLELSLRSAASNTSSVANKSIMDLEGELESEVLLHGEEHPAVARVYNELAHYYIANERYHLALEYFGRAKDLLVRLYGENDEGVIDIDYRIDKLINSQIEALSTTPNQDLKNHRQQTFQRRCQLDADNSVLGLDEHSGRIRNAMPQDYTDSTLVYSDLAEEARLKGKFEEAIRLYLFSINLRRKKFGDKNPALTSVLLHYSDLLQQCENFSEAKSVLEEALAINLHAYGRRHPAVAQVLNELGLVHMRLEGKVLLTRTIDMGMMPASFNKQDERHSLSKGNPAFDRAELLLKEALEIRRELFGDMDLTVAASLNSLAELYREGDDFYQAISYHNLSVEAYERCGGVDHPGTINAKGNLGITLRRYARQNNDRSEELLHEALRYMKQNGYNDNHPWVQKFDIENTIHTAQRLAEQGKHEDSLALFDDLLRKKKKLAAIMPNLVEQGVVAPNSLLTGDFASDDGDSLSLAVIEPVESITLTNTSLQLGQEMMLISEGKIEGLINKARRLIYDGLYSAAEDLLLQCSELPPQLMSDDHIYLSDVKLLQGKCRFELADFDSANNYYVEALQGKIDLFGPDSVKLVEVMLWIAELREMLASYDEAETFYSQVLSMVQASVKLQNTSHGASEKFSISFIQATLGMARIHMNFGAYDLAKELILQVFQLCSSDQSSARKGDLFVPISASNPIRADCLIAQADLAYAYGDIVNFQDFCREAHTLLVRQLGENHVRTASALLKLGTVHMVKSEFHQSGDLIDRAYGLLTFHFGSSPKHPKVSLALHLKALLYLKLDKVQEAKDHALEALSARQALYVNHDMHPQVAESLFLAAEIYMALMDTSNAILYYESALDLRRHVYASCPEHPSICEGLLGLSIVAISKGFYIDAVKQLEECMAMRERQLQTIGVSNHIDMIPYLHWYARVLLTMGRWKEAELVVGTCGACVVANLGDNHLFIGDCLLLKGSISKLRGKHRNAKYQFSLCLSIKIAKFGRYDHQDIIEVLLQAADNMRQVGYFNDALETTLLVETLISGRFGKSSIPAAWYMLLHANILCDRQKVSKAEELYCSAVEIVKRESLDNTYLHMQLIHGLARCYHSNNKISDADNLYLEAQQLCKTLFGSQCYAFFEIRCDHLFLKLNSKPFEQTKALTALKDEVLLFYVTEFGPLHPKTVHTKGRIGILTSRQKKDSGKKLISDCLRYFDENKQYPFCYDHPWVMELGGYTKKASKERLSSIVQENSIAGWSYPIFEGDTNFGYKVMPSTLLVDVKNYNPEVWGNVHYYGGDRLSYDSPIDPVKRISAFGVKYLKGSTNGQGTKEISTDAVEQGEKILSDAKQELIGDTTESVGTVEDDQRSISSLPIRHLQEMVEAEAQARLEVEKNYSREQKARQALEKQLEVELVTRKALDEDLLREKAERAVLEARLKDITSVAFDKVEEAKALSAAVAVIDSLNEPVEEKNGDEQTHVSFVDNVSLVGPQKSVNEAISDEIPSMKETFSQESLAENKYNDRDTVTSSENATIHNLSDLISTIPDEKQSSDINTDDVSHTISTLPMITTEDADSAPRDLLLSTIEEYELSAETTQKGISPSSTVEAERDTSMLYNDAEMIGKLEDDLAKNPKEHNITLSTVLDSVTSRSSIDRNLSSDLPDVSSSDMNSRLPKALYVDAHGFDESAALAEEIDHKKGENEEYIADANTSPAIAISHIESHQELSESASKEIGIRPSSFIDDQITTESKNVLVDGKQAGPGEATYTSASVEVPVVRLSEEEIKRNSALEAAIFLHNRGLSLYNNGYFQKALPLFEECLAVRGDYIPTDSLTASTIVDIGKNYVALSSWDLAEDFFAKALAIRQNSSNEEEIAKIYYEWAKCFYIQGLLFDSLDRINLAIKTLSQFLKGETNSLYGECLILQALVTVGLGKVVEAKAMADRGHAIVNKFNGANHMTGADAMTVKAQIMCVIGRAKEAISLIEQGFVLRKRLLERESHPILADSLLLMGSAFFDIGRFVDAENKLNAAYLMRVEYFGDKDIRAAEVQHFQGNLHQALGNFDLAISLHKTALAIRSAQCHPQKRLIFLSDSHNSLAEVYTNCGIFKEAIFHYNEALEIRSERLTDPALIAGLKEQKLKQEAGEVLQELLEVPPDHMKVAESKCGKAELLRLLGSYIEARELIDQSLQGRRAVFGKEHMSFIESQFVFGNILMDTGDFDNANRYHSRSIKIVRQLLGEEHHLYAKALLCKAENLRRKALQRADDSRTNTTGEDGDQENKMSDPLSNANSLVVEALQSLKYAFDGVGRKVPLQIIGEILETSVALTRRILESRKNKLIQSINTVPESVENNTIGENLDICTETNKKEVSFDREKYSNIVHSLERLFLDVIKVFPMVGKNHYLALFIIGTVGVAKLFEFDDRQRYYSSLSHENKKAFREQDLLSLSKVNDQLVDWLEILGITKSPSVQHESNDSEENDQPPGLKEINVVIKKLRSPKFVGLSEMHPWIRFLQEVASNFEYVPDEMELAALAFQKAEKLHKQGKFPEADLLYDNAFVTQINFLGPVAASTSVAIAETLIAKAENCRVQGLLDLAKLLFTQSMSILRKNSGDANPLVTVAMFGNANVLFDRGLYDDALALHITVFNMQNKHFGERSVQVNKTLIRIAYDQFKLGRCMEAFEIVQGALKNLLQVKEEVHQAHGDEDAADFGGAYLCLAYITLALGKFQDCKNYVDVAYSVRKVSALAIGISNYDDHYRVLEVLICRAQYLLTIGRIFESHKLVDMLMKAQIKLFCRSSVVVNRLSDQSIAFVNNFDSFADVSHTDSELLKQEANRPKKVNEIEEDYDLQKEIDAADSNLASSIGDTTNSVVSVAMLYAGNVSVFNYKGLPLSTHPALIDTFLIRARICMLMADLSQAKEMLTGSSAMIDALLPNRQSVLKLTISFEQGNLAQCRGCYEEAKNIHNSVMQQRLSICSEESADKGDSLFALGIANLSLSRLDDSTQIFSQSLEERMKCFGPDHWKLCEIFNACADVKSKNALYSESEDLYRKAIELVKSSFGVELHLIIAESLIGLSFIALSTGSLDLAYTYADQAKSMRSLLLGDVNPLTAACLFQIAAIQRAQGRVLEVKRSLNSCIASQRSKYGKYHPVTVTTLISIAFNFTDLAKYSTAGHVFERANQLLRKSLGGDHLLVAGGLSGLAENYKLEANFEKAIEMHEKALYIRRKLLGERHPAVARSLYFLAELFLELAKYDEAKKYFDDALALQRMTFGQSHPHIADTLDGLALVFLACGKIADAKFTHERAFFIRKTVLGSDHPALGDSQFRLAQVSRRLGRTDQAGALFERCLNTIRELRGSKHPLVGSVLYNIAEVANLGGQYDRAKDLFLQSLQIRLDAYKSINENHPEIAESYFGLAENLRARGLYDIVNNVPSNDSNKNNNKSSKTTRDPPQVANELNLELSGKLFDHSNEQENTVNRSNEAEEELQAILDGTDLATTREDNNETEKSEEKSVPTVMISAIENLDRSVVTGINTGDGATGKSGLGDSRSIILQDEKFKALPLYRRVLNHQLAVYGNKHPKVMITLLAIADTLRAMGEYDEALETIENILVERRKLFGDNHPDVVATMLSLGETLLAKGKLFPSTPSGNFDSKQVRKSKTAKPTGPSLVQHLSSVVKPIAEIVHTAVPARTTNDLNDKLILDELEMQKAALQAVDAGRWSFLSKVSQEKKNKAPLKIARGYMGYEFPTAKKIVRDDSNSVSRTKILHLDDAKWLFESGINLQKRLCPVGESSAVGMKVEESKTSAVDHPQIASLLFAKGELFRARRDFTLAMNFYEQALMMRRRIFRGTHPSVADCLNGMAEVFRLEHKFNQAEPLFDKALEIRMTAFASNTITDASGKEYVGLHPSIAEVKNNIALMKFSQGKFEDSQVLFEDALFICEVLLGVKHAATALCLGNLAGIYHSSGYFEKSNEMYLRALNVKREVFGTSHDEVATVLNNLGLLKKDQKLYIDALSCYLDAEKILKELHGEIHPDLAATYNNIAGLYLAQGKQYDAKTMFKKSLDMRIAIFGMEHTTVASSLNNYGTLLYSMGEPDSAKDLFEDSLRVRKKLLGENHPLVAETLNNIGLLLCSQGNTKDGLSLYEDALNIKIHSFGSEKNPSIATTMHNLAAIYHKLGSLQHSQDMYRRVLNIRVECLGKTHSDTICTMENLFQVEKDIKNMLELKRNDVRNDDEDLLMIKN